MKRKTLFSNGTDFMMWQSKNCDRCVKASRYNPKTDTYTKYRCAVQRNIEMSSVTDGMGMNGLIKRHTPQYARI